MQNANKPVGYHSYYSPPPCEEIDTDSQIRGSRWHPRNWTRCILICVVVAVIVILIAIILGAVLPIELAYPDYKPLNYTLVNTYHGTDFFDSFDYYTGYDPSSGFVHYVPQSTAEQYNLTYASSSSAVLRVDHTTADATTGRYSVRITSKQQYNSGLFIFDVLNSPYGCSTWPALWLSDPSNWPENGEIDVMEAVNQGNTGNQMTLHTTKHCKMDVRRKETGSALKTNCWNGTNENDGCGVTGATDTYGETFNALGGGVYAIELRDAGIRMWFWPRGDVPSDIPSDVSNHSAPSTANWGAALADFPSTDCDISSHFKNQSIIANIDLCGTWAGATSIYSTKDQCPGSCTDYVAQYPAEFDKAFWEWRSWRVYQATD